MEDLVAWARTQAEALRRTARGEYVPNLDWEGVAEEIGSIARVEQRRLWWQLTVVVKSLLLMRRAPPAVAAELRVEWRVMATHARIGVGKLLRDSSSLRADLAAGFEDAKRDAVELAAPLLAEWDEDRTRALAADMRETVTGYTLERVLDRDLWLEGSGRSGREPG